MWLLQPVKGLDLALNRVAYILDVCSDSQIGQRICNIAYHSEIFHQRFCEHDSDFGVIQPKKENVKNCPWYIFLCLLTGSTDLDNITNAMEMFQEHNHDCKRRSGYISSRHCIEQFVEVTKVRLLKGWL